MHSTQAPQTVTLDAASSVPANDPRLGLKPARPPILRRPTLREIMLPAIVFVGFVAIWDIAVRRDWVDEIIVPPPGDVASALWDLLDEPFFWDAVEVTMKETFYGFALGVCIGLVLGVLIGTVKTFRQAFYPFVIVFQSMPRVALAPVFLTWFGFGLASKVVMAAAICFFPIVINTVVGLESIDPNGKLLMRSLGVNRRQMFRYLTLPSAAPYIFAGLKTALTLALLGAIVAEFVGASQGLGVLIKQFNFQLSVADGFAVVFFLAFVGLLLFGLIELIDRRVIFWRSRENS